MEALGMSTLKVNTIQTSAGVEVFTAKAWVNFNGEGTVAIRDSGNVSSVTDNATGRYTANLTSAMANSNYEVSGSAGKTSTTASQEIIFYGSNVTPTSPSTTAVGVKVVNSAGTAIQDATYVTLAVQSN